jgi:hypothetical protein
MIVPEALQRIAAELNRVGIPYMLTGSFASVFYGSPRSTQDIDLVIAANRAQLQTFVESLARGEYYVEADAALEALKHESLFNIIDLKTSWKIDMIIRKSRAFSQEEFGRRRLSNVEGVALHVASAEDVILAKLEWAKLCASQRQIDDAAGILKLRGDSLDRPYLDKWVRGLGLAAEWSAAQRVASISGTGELDGSG